MDIGERGAECDDGDCGHLKRGMVTYIHMYICKRKEKRVFSLDTSSSPLTTRWRLRRQSGSSALHSAFVV